jgi:hypothetical protein
VKRRTSRLFVYVLLALQLLLSVPGTSVWAAEASGHAPAAAGMDCDGMDMPEAMSMPQAKHHSKHCPLCPDGTMGAGALGCSATCASSAAVIPFAHYFLSGPAAVLAVEPLPVIFHPLADPPPKPPPII